jgi:hypothetical protein
MPYLEDHKAKFDNLRVSLDAQNRDQLKRKANGGNTILFTYPPEEEQLYIDKIKTDYSDGTFVFIDVSKLLVQFIDLDGWNDFSEYYKDFKDTPHLVFKSDDESEDLMDLIIKAIVEADEKGQAAVLIRTGALFGTGIDNVNIMEHKSVMNLKHPLIIMYPSKLESDNLYFLNFKLASKYRCTVIE